MTKAGKYQDWLTKDGLTRIESWARDGLTNTQIAKNMGIAASTLQEWVKKFPEFSDTLKKGKEPIDFQVENALLKRALGYEYEETSTVVEKDVEGKTFTKVTRHKKVMQPDTTAAIFWLKNRKPDTWRKLAPEISAKHDKELEKLTLETKMLEYEVSKLEKSGQVNDLLEALVEATKIDEGELDD